MKNKILIISFNYPPVNNMASLRIGKIAKYLTQFNWEVRVLTIKREIRGNYILDLAVETPEENIIRVPFLNFFDNIQKFLFRYRGKENVPFKGGGSFRIFKFIQKQFYAFWENYLLRIMPDSTFSWVAKAVQRGIELINKENIKVIFSTHIPPSSHFIAYWLNKKTKVPWIADFADPWSFNHQTKRVFPLRQIEEIIEKNIIKRATFLTTTTEPFANQLRNLHNKKTFIISCGYDEEDYSNCNVDLVANKFTITYTGAIYKKFQNIYLLFESIKELISENKIKKSDFSLYFFTIHPDYIDYLSRKYDLKEIIYSMPYLSYKEMILKQKTSTILLSFRWNKKDGIGVCDGKNFGYLGAQRPILAIGPQGGVVENLLYKCNAGILLDDKKKIKEKILEWYQEFKKYKNIYFNPNLLEEKKYTYYNLSMKLSRLIGENIDL